MNFIGKLATFKLNENRYAEYRFPLITSYYLHAVDKNRENGVKATN